MLMEPNGNIDWFIFISALVSYVNKVSKSAMPQQNNPYFDIHIITSSGKEQKVKVKITASTKSFLAF